MSSYFIRKGLPLIIILLSSSLFLSGCGSNTWTLSVYKDDSGGGHTDKRIGGYTSKQECLKDGFEYSEHEKYRFDCGYNCTEGSSLQDGVVCKEVCDTKGCRQ